MSNITDKAKEYLSYQLSVIPTKEDKTPTRAWTTYQKERLKEEEVDNVFSGYNVKGLAIICGAISGGLEVIDVDCKYDITGSLWEDLRTLIQDNLPELYKSLVIAQTKSGGYHIYYRCSQPGGNVKLANRPTTVEERKKEPQDKIRVLIETRGEGGYVIAPPTPGYKFIQGEPEKIATITPQQKEILFSISKSFNEVEEEKPKIKATPPETSTGLSPWEDYNNRGDIVALLKSKGWRVIDEKGDRINLLRPGEAHSKTSGNFHTGLRTLRVWSTSTEFEITKAYSPAQAFSLLECNEDSKLTYRRLLDLGYGEPYKGDKKASDNLKTEKIKVEVVNNVNRETSVISTPGDSLRVENIQTAKGEEIVITSPGPEAEDEVLKAIALIEETGKRIYVKEGKEPEVRDFHYRLNTIIEKYISIDDERGGLSGRDVDNLKDEVVEASARIKEPIDRDIFKQLFLYSKGTKRLGITEESLAITVEKLTTTRAKNKQDTELKKLLSETKDLQDKGETDKALELLDNRVKEVKIIASTGLLPTPLSFSTLMDEIATMSKAKKTGYSSLDKIIEGFNPGTITLIAGRPSHGKTALLLNIMVNQFYKYPENSFYFFTYEMPVKNLSIRLLNRLTATDLREYYEEYEVAYNSEFIKAYIRAQRTDIKELEEGKRRLQELIDSQRFKVIDRNYSVEELSRIIAYLSKKEKIGGVFIDYIQRMRTEKPFRETTPEVAYISKQVLQIAKDTDLPIILGAQLNRATVTTGDKKPSLENLKASGSLEEDAHTVFSIYDETRENQDQAIKEGRTFESAPSEVDLEIMVLKNREGEVNRKAILTHDKKIGLIKDRGNSTG